VRSSIASHLAPSAGGAGIRSPARRFRL